MADTPTGFYETAARLRGGGHSLSTVVNALQADGASDLDLTRVVMRIYAVGVGDARRLLAEAGLPRFLEPLTAVVRDDDAWHEMQLDPDPPADETVLPG